MKSSENLVWMQPHCFVTNELALHSLSGCDGAALFVSSCKVACKVNVASKKMQSGKKETGEKKKKDNKKAECSSFLVNATTG